MSGSRWRRSARSLALAILGGAVAATATLGQGGPPPSAPTGVVGTAVSSTEIALVWNAVTDAQGGVKHYNVYRDGVVVGTPTTITFNDTGLQASTTYDYQISAVDSMDREGAKSGTVSVTTMSDTTPPTTPGGLQASATGPQQVDLSWQAASDPESGVASYNVYRDGAVVGTTSGTTFSDTGVQPQTTYSYEVSAVNGDGLEGGRSSPATATTPAAPDTTPPTTPTALQASATGPQQVDLSWQAASDPESGVASYNVYRDGAVVGTTSGTTFSDTGVQPQTTYSYEVSAVNGDGLEGGRSAPASVTTPAPADTTPPTTPTGLQVSPVGPRQVDLTWQAASDPESGVSSYNVYRDDALIASAPGTTYSDTTVQAQTTYVFEVSAVNGDGLEGSRSVPTNVTTPTAADTTPPTAPANLQADVAGPRRIELQWNAATDAESGVASYNVYRDGALVGSVAGLAFVDTGVEPRTTYGYTVTAVNGEGLEGPASAAVTAATPVEPDTVPPAPPTRLRIIR